MEVEVDVVLQSRVDCPLDILYACFPALLDVGRATEDVDASTSVFGKSVLDEASVRFAMLDAEDRVLGEDAELDVDEAVWMAWARGGEFLLQAETDFECLKLGDVVHFDEAAGRCDTLRVASGEELAATEIEVVGCEARLGF